MQPIFASVCAMLLLAAASALPAKERYVWIPDAQGNIHLEDLLHTEPNPRAVNCNTEVELRLYTRSNPSSPQVIKTGDSTSAPNFNAANPTRFITHGWTSNAGSMTNFVTAYMNTGSNYNVVLIDWSGPASPAYATAITNLYQVASCVAASIQDLRTNRGLNLNNVFVIGHSLGGQMAGSIGSLLGGAVKQIVGLDPAGPSFEGINTNNRLDPTDGQLVQVLHTNGGTLGYRASCGDIDFFPNGGSSQAGCTIDLLGSCSHGRAPTFYAESITNNAFVSRQCASYSSYTGGSCNNNARDVMGEYASGSTSGNFYLQTNSRSPFAAG